jgi:hypothetical protein
MTETTCNDVDKMPRLLAEMLSRLCDRGGEFTTVCRHGGPVAVGVIYISTIFAGCWRLPVTRQPRAVFFFPVATSPKASSCTT